MSVFDFKDYIASGVKGICGGFSCDPREYITPNGKKLDLKPENKLYVGNYDTPFDVYNYTNLEYNDDYCK